MEKLDVMDPKVLKEREDQLVQKDQRVPKGIKEFQDLRENLVM